MATLPEVKIKTTVFRGDRFEQQFETLDGAPKIEHGGVLVIYGDSEIKGYALGEWVSFKTTVEQP